MPLPFPEFPERSCINCGFLTHLRVGGDAGERKEASEYQRAEGYYRDGGPTCFVLAPDLPLEKEAEALREGITENLDTFGHPDPQAYWDSYLTVTQRDRDCPEATIWRPGYTPKEHSEMLDRQRMLEWQHEREEDDKRWRAEQRTIDNRWHLGEIGVIVLGILVASIITLAAALISRNNVTVTYPPPSPSPVASAAPRLTPISSLQSTPGTASSPTPTAP